MDNNINNECKNYIHKYRCDTYNENHDACKNCEMRMDIPIVFTIQSGYMHHNVKIITKDPRAEESKHYSTWVDGEGVAFLDLFDVMVNISAELNNKGYAVLFEVD